MHRAAIHGIGIFSSVVVFGLLFEIATSQKESSAAECVRTEADGPCLYTHNLQHLTHRHKYEGHNVNVVEHLALLHAAQPDAELMPKATAVDKQTIEEYVNDHIWARTASNKRFRKFLAGSPLFASTTAGARPRLVEWYYTQTDSLLEQPSAFLTEDSETLQWLPKDEEWAEVHRNYSMQMANSQEIDLLLFGDSIFESTLGTSIGHQVRRAEGIPAVWQNYRKDSNKKVMAITGDTTVDLMWRLLNGAMPVTCNVKQVVLQIGSNNLLRQWFQVAEDPRLRPGAVAASIITVCNLIHATWPDTHILLAGVLVGGLRGDWGEGRSHKLPNRYSKAAAVINARLMDWVWARSDHNISFVDCSGLYIIPDDEVPGGLTINKSIMNDTLHPDGYGFSMMLDECFEPALRRNIDSAMFPNVIWKD
ncbi:H/ACA snoRNP pseudouridylase subunit [Trebouxia sp. C0010 RCD-2024]